VVKGEYGRIASERLYSMHYIAQLIPYIVIA
jgi:hypothetical protein